MPCFNQSGVQVPCGGPDVVSNTGSGSPNINQISPAGGPPIPGYTGMGINQIPGGMDINQIGGPAGPAGMGAIGLPPTQYQPPQDTGISGPPGPGGPGGTQYDPNDINQDGQVDVRDIVLRGNQQMQVAGPSQYGSGGINPQQQWQPSKQNIASAVISEGGYTPPTPPNIPQDTQDIQAEVTQTGGYGTGEVIGGGGMGWTTGGTEWTNPNPNFQTGGYSTDPVQFGGGGGGTGGTEWANPGPSQEIIAEMAGGGIIAPPVVDTSLPSAGDDFTPGRSPWDPFGGGGIGGMMQGTAGAVQGMFGTGTGGPQLPGGLQGGINTQLPPNIHPPPPGPVPIEPGWQRPVDPYFPPDLQGGQGGGPTVPGGINVDLGVIQGQGIQGPRDPNPVPMPQQPDKMRIPQLEAGLGRGRRKKSRSRGRGLQ